MSQRNCNYCNTELVRFRKDENGNWHRYEDNQMTVEHTYKRCKAIQLEKKNYVAPAPEGQSQLPKQLTNPPPSPAAPVQQQNQNQNQAFYSVLNKLNALDKEIKEIKKMLETDVSINDSNAQKITLLVEKVGYPKPEKLVMAGGNNGTMVKLDPILYNCRNCGKEYPDFQSRSKICCGDCIHILDEEIGAKLEPTKKQSEATKKLIESKENVDPSFQDLVRPKQFNINQQQEENKVIDPEKEDIEKNEAFQKTQEMIKKDLEPKPAAEEVEELIPGEPDDLDNNTTTTKEWEMISEKFVCSSCDQVFHNGWQHFSDTKYCDECKTNIEAKKAWQKIDERSNRTIEQINTEDDDLSF